MVLQGSAPKWALGLMFLFQTLSSFKTKDKQVGKNWEKSLGRSLCSGISMSFASFNDVVS